jgi:hypothetical protein
VYDAERAYMGHTLSNINHPLHHLQSGDCGSRAKRWTGLQ